MEGHVWMMDDVQVWHDDGHVMHMMLSGPDLSITMTECPNGGRPDNECWHPDVQGCVVSHFLQIYGLDCNVGSCEPAGQMQIAWSPQGNRNHIEEMQIWVIPVDDDMFSSWRATQVSS